MNFQPLMDRVLIKQVDAETVSPGGIHLPDSAADRPREGEIIAAGTGHYQNGQFVLSKMSVGDRVLFGKYAGTPVKIDGVEYVICREEDCFGVFK